MFPCSDNWLKQLEKETAANVQNLLLKYLITGKTELNIAQQS